MSIPCFGQKFGYIDADYILSQMPSYQKAQQDIQESASKWQEDIENRMAAVDKLKEKFKAEEILLTEEMRKERNDEIGKKEKEIRDYQKKIFGFQGLFFTRQQELMKPAREELNKSVEKVARREKIQILFSNSEGLTIIYAEPRHDYTEEVLQELGLLEPEENPEKGKNTNVEKSDDLENPLENKKEPKKKNN